MASPHQRRKLMSMGNRPSFSREMKLQWAGSRERISPSGRGGAFFLTSLFIELIDTMMSAMAMFRQSSLWDCHDNLDCERFTACLHDLADKNPARDFGGR